MAQLPADDGPRCAFCRRGFVGIRDVDISCREMTDRGWVECRLTLALGTCDDCGQLHLTEAMDELINSAIRRARDALPAR